jgi:hypothetical protein
LALLKDGITRVVSTGSAVCAEASGGRDYPAAVTRKAASQWEWLIAPTEVATSHDPLPFADDPHRSAVAHCFFAVVQHRFADDQRLFAVNPK